MQQLTDKQTLALLVKVVNCTIQDFFYFPDVIIVGKRKIEREEFHFLLSEGYIAYYRADSFGRFFRLTDKAEAYINSVIGQKQTYYRKKVKAASKQGLLNLV